MTHFSVPGDRSPTGKPHCFRIELRRGPSTPEEKNMELVRCIVAHPWESQPPAELSPPRVSDSRESQPCGSLHVCMPGKGDLLEIPPILPPPPPDPRLRGLTGRE